MSKSRRLSTREAWLLALLPAALLAIVWAVVSDSQQEIDRLRGQLRDAEARKSPAQMSDELIATHQRIKDAKERLSNLESSQEELTQQIAAAQSPTRDTGQASVAEKLHRLDLGLARLGVRLISTKMQGAAASSQWQVEVAGTWPQMQKALSDPEAFPPGLALMSIRMDRSSASSPLRKWTLNIQEPGRTP